MCNASGKPVLNAPTEQFFIQLFLFDLKIWELEDASQKIWKIKDAIQGI